jgi:hypothetical protein
LQHLSIPQTNIEMEEKMKKTDQKSGLLYIEVSVDIDFTANVNLGKQGGGGSNM